MQADIQSLKISFIGGGNMARALISGLLQKGVSPTHINVIESDPAKRQALVADFSVLTTDQLPSITKSDVVILAVKPQHLRDVAIFLGSLLSQQLVISIAAGVRVQDLATWLGGYRTIIRVMPNTPAQIQKGVSALFATNAVNTTQRESAETLMQAVGQTLWLDQEEKMDAVTAISGSGPAYVFYFIEALESAAAKLGFTPDQARMLAVETFSGAVQLAAMGTASPSELRVQVTSKGGTTEQALLSMQSAGVQEAIIKAAEAAAMRSKELGDILGKH